MIKPTAIKAYEHAPKDVEFSAMPHRQQQVDPSAQFIQAHQFHPVHPSLQFGYGMEAKTSIAQSLLTDELVHRHAYAVSLQADLKQKEEVRFSIHQRENDEFIKEFIQSEIDRHERLKKEMIFKHKLQEVLSQGTRLHNIEQSQLKAEIREHQMKLSESINVGLLQQDLTKKASYRQYMAAEHPVGMANPIYQWLAMLDAHQVKMLEFFLSSRRISYQQNAYEDATTTSNYSNWMR